MRTRSRKCEPELETLEVIDSRSDLQTSSKRRRHVWTSCANKRVEFLPDRSSGIPSAGKYTGGSTCFVDALPDDLLIQIFARVSATASSPLDLVRAILTCKRFAEAGRTREVLSRCSWRVLSVKASKWSKESDKFLNACADAGNVEACYMLGMIYFYCLQLRDEGIALMEKAAIHSNTYALLSLAAIRFNGSGRTRRDKDLRSGFNLCAKAATLGHLDAVRELGHCWQDGYGVPVNDLKGKRLLMIANTLERILAESGEASPQIELFSKNFLRRALHSDDAGFRNIVDNWNAMTRAKMDVTSGKAEKLRTVHVRMLKELFSSLFTDVSFSGGGGLSKEPQVCQFFRRPIFPFGKIHPANVFLVDWFRLHPPLSRLKVCSQPNCGRPETRRHEFRRCSACCLVHYCSRSCQALDWKLHHRQICVFPPVHGPWEAEEE